MKITIVGGGPRGLAVAIQALKKGLSVDLIDLFPIKNWNTKNNVINFQMRSPSSFDLVTNVEELSDWSFNKFLKTEEDIYATRSEFEKYLNYCWNRLKRYKNFNWIADSVVQINKNKTINLKFRGRYKFEKLIIANGITKFKEINWLKNSIYEHKLVNDKFLLKNNLENKNILIVGNGQGAAELVSILNKTNEVTWFLKKEYKVNQFPIPSEADWGYKNCFSNYFFSLSVKEKKKYLKEVKQFTPTITPQIVNKVKLTKKVISDKVSIDLSKFDYIFNKTGFNTSFKESLLKDFNEDKYFSSFLDINENFKLDNQDIYVTGLLAVHIGGPSQGSIYSAAQTAQTIINDILK